MSHSGSRQEPSFSYILVKHISLLEEECILIGLFHVFRQTNIPRGKTSLKTNYFKTFWTSRFLNIKHGTMITHGGFFNKSCVSEQQTSPEGKKHLKQICGSRTRWTKRHNKISTEHHIGNCGTNDNHSDYVAEDSRSKKD